RQSGIFSLLVQLLAGKASPAARPNRESLQLRIGTMTDAANLRPKLGKRSDSRQNCTWDGESGRLLCMMVRHFERPLPMFGLRLPTQESLTVMNTDLKAISCRVWLMARSQRRRAF